MRPMEVVNLIKEKLLQLRKIICIKVQDIAELIIVIIEGNTYLFFFTCIPNLFYFTVDPTLIFPLYFHYTCYKHVFTIKLWVVSLKNI